MAAMRGLAAMASSRSMGVSAEVGVAAAAFFFFAAFVAAAGVAGEAATAAAFGVGAAVGWCAGAAGVTVAFCFCSSSRFSRSARFNFFSNFFAALPDSFRDELTRLQREHKHSEEDQSAWIHSRTMRRSMLRGCMRSTDGTL